MERTGTKNYAKEASLSKKEKGFSSEWIHKLDDRYNWDLYWHQLDLVINKCPIQKDDLLFEIGVGTGLTSGYLKKKGYQIRTLDIDKDKEPDIIADITNFEFPEANCYMAFEVFEHIPFEEAISVWKKLYKKEVNHIIISIPYAFRTYFWASYWTPFFGEKSFRIGRKRNRINAKHHFWELGFENMTKEKVVNTFKEIGYTNRTSYRYRSHHFFIFSLNDTK